MPSSSAWAATPRRQAAGAAPRRGTVSFRIRPERGKHHTTSIATCREGGQTGYPLGLGEAWQVPTFHSAEELGCRAGVRTLGKSREKVSTASVCEPRDLLSAGYGSIPQPTLYAPKSAFGDVTLALAVCRILPSPKTDREIVVAGLGSVPPATSRRMSTRRSGGVTPSPATAIASTSSGPHRAESP